MGIKITDLVEQTSIDDDDVLAIVDVAANTTKKIKPGTLGIDVVRSRIVDGKRYALTRAGIQAAIDAANTAGGGVVYVVEDVTSDGTALNLKSNVIVDFTRRSYKLIAGGTVMNLVSNPDTTNTDYALTVNAVEGADTVTLSAANAANFAVDDYVLVYDSAPRAHRHITRVEAVDAGTGVITLRDPLTHAYTTANASNLRRFSAGVVSDAGLRNVVLDGNGNTGIGSRLFRSQGFTNRLVLENIRLTGTLTPPASGNAFDLTNAYEPRIRGLRSESLQVGAAQRDIQIAQVGNGVIDRILSMDCQGFGPGFSNLHHCTVGDVTSVRAGARGLRIDQSAHNVFNNVVSSNHKGASGDGLRVAFNSHDNVFNGLVTNDNTDKGLVFDDNGGVGGEANHRNVVIGLISFRNGASDNQDLEFAVGNVGNFVIGKYGVFTGLAGDNQAVNVNAAGDWVMNIQGVAAPVGGDFAQNESLIITRASDTSLRFSVKGSDGVVRSGTLAIA